MAERINLWSLFKSDPAPKPEEPPKQHDNTVAPIEAPQTFTQRFEQNLTTQPAPQVCQAPAPRSIPIPVASAVQPNTRVFTAAQIAAIKSGGVQPIVFSAEQVANARGGVVFNAAQINQVRQDIQEGNIESVDENELDSQDNEPTLDSITLEALNKHEDVGAALWWAQDIVNGSDIDIPWDGTFNSTNNTAINTIVQFVINMSGALAMPEVSRMRVVKKAYDESDNFEDFYDQVVEYRELYIG